MPPKRTLRRFFSETKPFWEMGLGAVLALLLGFAALHLAWIATNITRTKLILLVILLCYALFWIRHFFRLGYATVEIVIGLFVIFGTMDKAPEVVDDPATSNLLLVQLAAGIYIIIRGFDNFAQAEPFASAGPAFRAVWDLSKTLWVRIRRRDSPLNMASDHNPSNRTMALREALQGLWNRRLRLAPHCSLALGTWALALVGLWALWDNEIALERSQRAWVAPFAARHDAGIVVGHDFAIKIMYQNPGKEPAIDVSDNFTGDKVDTIKSGEGWDTLVIPSNHSCDGATPRKGQWVVYPSAINERHFAVVAETVDQPLASGTKVLYIQGCFIYSTFGKRHRSSYCFYLEPVPDQPSEKWQLKNCPGEGQAYAD
jgi:hypothetical protein